MCTFSKQNISPTENCILKSDSNLTSCPAVLKFYFFRDLFTYGDIHGRRIAGVTRLTKCTERAFLLPDSFFEELGSNELCKCKGSIKFFVTILHQEWTLLEMHISLEEALYINSTLRSLRI